MIQINNTVRLSVGGIVVELISDDDGLINGLCQVYKEFSTDAKAQFSAQITIKKGWEHVNYRDPDQYFIDDVLHIDGGTFHGVVFCSRDYGELTVSSNISLQEIEYYLRAIYAVLGFKAGGVMLHAAGIIREARAYLFFGHSGSGKTTVTKLSHKYRVLNDDLLLLLPIGGEWFVYATPFWNAEHNKENAKDAPLNKMFRLVQDKEDYIVEIDRGVAIAEILSNVPVIPANQSWGNELLHRCEEIMDAVGVYWLHFRKSDSFWKVIGDMDRKRFD